MECVDCLAYGLGNILWDRTRSEYQPSFVTLDKLFNLSGSQFPHLSIGIKNTFLIGVAVSK